MIRTMKSLRGQDRLCYNVRILLIVVSLSLLIIYDVSLELPSDFSELTL